ncbi:MAG: DUF945 family protein [Chromatiales bacterium]|jgi:hypothetical protein
MTGWGRRLVRTALIAFALSIALGLSLPLLSGLWLQRHYSALLAQSDAAGWLRVEGLRFERGWFRSRVSLIVSLAGLRPRYVIEHWVSHGPVFLDALWSDRPATGLARAQGQIALSEVSGRRTRPILIGQSWLGLHGGLRSHWREPLRLDESTGRRIELVLDSETRGLDLSIAHPALELTFDDRPLQLESLQIESRMRLLAHGLFPEELSVTAGRVGLEIMEAPVVLSEARLVAVVDAVDDRFSAELVAGARRVGETRHGVGPVSVKAWFAELEQLGLGWPLAFPSSPRPDPASTPRGPRVEIADLSVETRDGRFVADASLALEPESADWRRGELEAELRMSRRLLRSQLEHLFRYRLSRSLGADSARRIRGSLLTEEIDERAATRADKQLAILTTQGYLRSEGQDVQTRVSWRSGQMSLNGKPVELARIISD